MEWVEVRDQAELEKALGREGVVPVCIGNGRFVARESSHVVAWGSSHVVARESSHVVAWGSSHVVAWGSSHVVAWESSHVVAWESSHVVARESSHVEAGKYVAVHRQSTFSKVNGGVVIEKPEIKTAEDWLDYYGVEATAGVVVLFKAVNDDFSTQRDATYTPGTEPQAPDWDGGKKECGGGLHFSPHPALALEFKPGAKRFVACPLKVSDIVVHPDPMYPAKVKAKGVCAAVYEVDRRGERVEQPKETVS